MTSPAFRRAVVFGLLALFVAPIVVLGVSPADRVHGLRRCNTSRGPVTT